MTDEENTKIFVALNKRIDQIIIRLVLLEEKIKKIEGVKKKWQQ